MLEFVRKTTGRKGNDDTPWCKALAHFADGCRQITVAGSDERAVEGIVKGIA